MFFREEQYAGLRGLDLGDTVQSNFFFSCLTWEERFSNEPGANRRI